MKFVYTVQNSQGNISTGVIESGNEDEAVLELQNKGYFILSIQPEKKAAKSTGLKSFRARKVGGYDLAFFGEQLATLISGGIPLVRSLTLLSEHSDNRTLGKVLSDVAKEVSAGGAFYKALSKHPRVFDSIWVSLVQAGEVSGQLPSVLRQISTYIQSNEKIKSTIITALSYPAILVSVAIGVLTFFIVSIVPKFATVFGDTNVNLPLITRIIIGISNFMASNFLVILIGVILLVVAAKTYISTDAGRLSYNRFTMQLPIFGRFIRNVQFERLLTTMSTLVKSGVSILNTISVLEGSFAKNIVIKRALRSVRQDVASGKSISVSFKNTKIFPNLVTEMMWMGEESGKLPDIITTLSRFYNEQIKQFVARFSSVIDPILILFVGAIIGTVIISLFLPILRLSQIGIISG